MKFKTDLCAKILHVARNSWKKNKRIIINLALIKQNPTTRRKGGRPIENENLLTFVRI